jgi:hypothetical protein
MLFCTSSTTDDVDKRIGLPTALSTTNYADKRIDLPTAFVEYLG